MFPSPRASTDYGFNFDRIPTAGLFVGSVGVKPASAIPKVSAVSDLSQYMTAGFRISNGTVAWRDPGTEYACNIPLPCPATDGPGYQPPAEGLRLRLTGTLTVTAAFPPAPKISPGGNVVVEGFNLATGKTLWSYDAGADASLADNQAPPLLGAHVVALPAPGGGMTAVNLATGTRRPVSPATSAWCKSPVTYQAQPHSLLSASTNSSPRPCSASPTGSMRTGGCGLASQTQIMTCTPSEASHSQTTACVMPRDACTPLVISSDVTSSTLSLRAARTHSRRMSLTCRRADGTAPLQDTQPKAAVQ